MQSFTIEVRMIGQTALQWLATRQHGEVLAAVSHAIYLRTDHNDLFWISDGTASLHRRCLQVASPLPGFEVGACYTVKDHKLLMDSRIAFDFRYSRTWNEPALPPGAAVPISSLPDRLTAVCGFISDWPQPAGVCAFIPIILNPTRRPVSMKKERQLGSLPTSTMLAVNGITMACLSHDYSLLLKYAGSLVGQGEGLTPSGDDFLGGLFFCLQLLHNTYSEVRHLANWTCSDFIPQCEPLTNVISFALLKDHADGHAMEPLHDFSHALLADYPIDSILSSASRLVAVGHSTGWDLLTGFLAGMSVTFGNGLA